MKKAYGASEKMAPISDVEKKLGCELYAYELRVKGGAYYGFSALSVSTSEDRMKKKSDIFVFDGENEKSIVARNRFTKETVQIPKSAVCKQIRRLSGVGTIDISSDNEYLISKPYGGLPDI